MGVEFRGQCGRRHRSGPKHAPGTDGLCFHCWKMEWCEEELRKFNRDCEADRWNEKFAYWLAAALIVGSVAFLIAIFIGLGTK